MWTISTRSSARRNPSTANKEHNEQSPNSPPFIVFVPVQSLASTRTIMKMFAKPVGAESLYGHIQEPQSNSTTKVYSNKEMVTIARERAATLDTPLGSVVVIWGVDNKSWILNGVVGTLYSQDESQSGYCIVSIEHPQDVRLNYKIRARHHNCVVVKGPSTCFLCKETICEDFLICKCGACSHRTCSREDTNQSSNRECNMCNMYGLWCKQMPYIHTHTANIIGSCAHLSISMAAAHSVVDGVDKDIEFETRVLDFVRACMSSLAEIPDQIKPLPELLRASYIQNPNIHDAVKLDKFYTDVLYNQITRNDTFDPTMKEVMRVTVTACLSQLFGVFSPHRKPWEQDECKLDQIAESFHVLDKLS